MIGGWYTLGDDERPVLMGDLPTFGFKALEVWPPLKTKVDGYEVSTVFLGLDHQYGFGEQGDPVLWETMIFGNVPVPWASGDDYEYQVRYTSADDARAGHEQTIQRLRDKIAEMTTNQTPAPTEATAREIAVRAWTIYCDDDRCGTDADYDAFIDAVESALAARQPEGVRE